MLGSEVEARRQILEVPKPVSQPVAVRLGSHQVALDLVVAHDAALESVDQEHAAWLEAAFLDDARLINVSNADLRRHHDQAVGGHPVTGGSQAVAVEHGSDDGPIGEGDACRTVPRLHQ